MEAKKYSKQAESTQAIEFDEEGRTLLEKELDLVRYLSASPSIVHLELESETRPPKGETILSIDAEGRIVSRYTY